jgi:hypothetical protein
MGQQKSVVKDRRGSMNDDTIGAVLTGCALSVWWTVGFETGVIALLTVAVFGIWKDND